jgi:hypothetical protein
MAGRRFRTLELDEAELDFILTFDPERAEEAVEGPFRGSKRLEAYRKYVNTVQSYIADGLA